jgi:hypothetical protein
VYYWGVEKGEYEGHVSNVKYEDHHLMVIDDETSEARRFTDNDIVGYSQWALYKFCLNGMRNKDFLFKIIN